MITSMSRTDLFRTIMGYDEHPHRNNTITAETGAGSTLSLVTCKSFGETKQPTKSVVTSGIDTFTYGNEIKVDKNIDPVLTFERSFDRLELSEDTTEEDEWNFTPYDVPDATDFFKSWEIHSRLRNGLTSTEYISQERIGEFFGNIAKRLDEAYSEGKFTKDEYDELNDMIANGMEWITKQTENRRALNIICKKRLSEWASRRKKTPEDMLRDIRTRIMTIDQIIEQQNKQVADYVSKHCLYDRNAVLKTFNSVRYGK